MIIFLKALGSISIGKIKSKLFSLLRFGRKTKHSVTQLRNDITLIYLVYAVVCSIYEVRKIIQPI